MNIDYILEDVIDVKTSGAEASIKVLTSTSREAGGSPLDERSDVRSVELRSSIALLRRLQESISLALSGTPTGAQIDVLEQASQHTGSEYSKWKMDWVRTIPASPLQSAGGAGSANGAFPVVISSSVTLAFRYGPDRMSIQVFVSAEHGAFDRLLIIPRQRCRSLLERLGGGLRDVRLTGPSYALADETLKREQGQSRSRVDSVRRYFPSAENCPIQIVTRYRVIESEEGGVSIVFSSGSDASLVLPMSRSDAHALLGVLHEMAVRARWSVPEWPWLETRWGSLRLVPQVERQVDHMAGEFVQGGAAPTGL